MIVGGVIYFINVVRLVNIFIKLVAIIDAFSVHISSIIANSLSELSFTYKKNKKTFEMDKWVENFAL